MPSDPTRLIPEGPEPRSNHIVSDVVAAISIAALEISTAVSLAVLIFAGDLSGGVSRASIAFMFGSTVVLLVVAWRTTLRTVIAGSQDAPAVVMAAIAAAIAADTAAEARLATVFVAIAIAGLLSSALFVVVGRARLGETARTIPFTVISGFMAGTGWILARGGVEVMTGVTTHLSDIGELFGWDLAQLWIPGVALAVFVVVSLERGLPSIAIGLAMLALAVAIHGIGRIGWSFEQLEANGWLIGPFPETTSWTPVRPSDLREADWTVLARQAGPIAGLAVVALLSMVLNVTGLEIACEDDPEVDHELQVAGVGNAISSLAGGLVGFHAFGLTLVSHRLRTRGFRVPLLIGILAAAVIVAGSGIVALMPRAVAGGLLMAAGLGLLVDWVRQLRRGMHRLDALLSTAVLAVIIVFGVLPGIVAGLLAAAMLFVFQYSRVSPIASTRTLETAASNVDRSSADRARLSEQASHVRVIELAGYLFFGSVRKISDEIRTSIEHSPLRFLIIDFRQVRGADASAMSGLEALERRAERAGVEILWSNVPPSLERYVLTDAEGAGADIPDLDRALELVEERLLDAQHAPAHVDQAWLDAVADFGTTTQLAAGDTLIDESDRTRKVFVIIEGTLTAWGETSAGKRLRFRQVGPGSLLGEVSFTTGSARTATVTADTDATVVALAPDDVEEMASRAPELAARTHQIIAQRLAERLDHTSRTVRELNR